MKLYTNNNNICCSNLNTLKLYINANENRPVVDST